MRTQPPIPPEIAEVTAADYLEGLATRPTAEVRRMRDICRRQAARLSYTRRVLHGQLDIARAELQRRSVPGRGTLLETIEEVLAASGGRPAVPHPPWTPVGEPDDPDPVLDWWPLATVPDLDDAALAEAIELATAHEAAVSRWRRQVLDALDRLQEELVARYRDGSATVDEAIGDTAAGEAG